MIKNEVITEFKHLLKDARFDYGAYALIDFKSKSFESIQLHNDKEINNIDIWFDLASITKSLTLAGAWLSKPEIFTPEMELLLEHRAGLPFWGRLSRDGWKDTVNQYAIKESEAVYSDFSALRLTLEIEKKSGDLYSLTDSFRDESVKYWKEKPDHVFSPVTGWRKGKLICGEVHDDNCFVIDSKVGHAGLFGTVDGLAQTLINYNEKLSMIEKLKPLLDKKSHRFVKGFDTPENLETTLAGSGCSSSTFGHTGFTGTSFWIDASKSRGWILLTNGAYPYWYDRLKLNNLRRTLGRLSW